MANVTHFLVKLHQEPNARRGRKIRGAWGSLSLWMTTVFVEQPLALHGSAKNVFALGVLWNGVLRMPLRVGVRVRVDATPVTVPVIIVLERRPIGWALLLQLFFPGPHNCAGGCHPEFHSGHALDPGEENPRLLVLHPPSFAPSYLGTASSVLTQFIIFVCLFVFEAKVLSYKEQRREVKIIIKMPENHHEYLKLLSPHYQGHFT